LAWQWSNGSHGFDDSFQMVSRCPPPLVFGIGAARFLVILMVSATPFQLVFCWSFLGGCWRRLALANGNGPAVSWPPFANWCFAGPFVVPAGVAFFVCSAFFQASHWSLAFTPSLSPQFEFCRNSERQKAHKTTTTNSNKQQQTATATATNSNSHSNSNKQQQQ